MTAAGPVTNVAFGVVRALDYVTIALVAGSLAFGLRVAREGPLAHRVARLLVAGAALGIVVSLLGIVLEAVELGRGTLRANELATALGSRFGVVWVVRAALLAGALLIGALPRRRWSAGALAAVAAYLVATPALAGHAAVQSPVWAFLPSDVIHVSAMSVWVGGVAAIVIALPPAIREAAPGDRTALALDVLGRFSPLALAATVALACTGLLQAYITVRTTSRLTSTTYGELVLLKIALVTLLLGFGLVNRERIIPALRRLVETSGDGRSISLLAARTTRGELAAMTAVLGVTAALVAYSPPVAAQASRSAVRHAPAASHATPQTRSTRTASPALIVRPLVSGSGSPGFNAPRATFGIASRALPKKVTIARRRPAISSQPISIVSEVAREPVSEPSPTAITQSTAWAPQSHSTESIAKLAPGVGRLPANAYPATSESPTATSASASVTISAAGIRTA
ncbi:MAG: copper resistance D family protein [Solirubrobacteraceae bacterium]